MGRIFEVSISPMLTAACDSIGGEGFAKCVMFQIHRLDSGVLDGVSDRVALPSQY